MYDYIAIERYIRAGTTRAIEKSEMTEKEKQESLLFGDFFSRLKIGFSGAQFVNCGMQEMDVCFMDDLMTTVSFYVAKSPSQPFKTANHKKVYFLRCITKMQELFSLVDHYADRRSGLNSYEARKKRNKIKSLIEDCGISFLYAKATAKEGVMEELLELLSKNNQSVKKLFKEEDFSFMSSLLEQYDYREFLK